MRAIVINDMEKIDRNFNALKVTCIDNHTRNGDERMINGFWLVNRNGNIRISADCGDVLHCLNEVLVQEDGRLHLSTASNAGVYKYGTYSGNGLNDVIGRIEFDSEAEAIMYLNIHNKSRKCIIEKRNASK